MFKLIFYTILVSKISNTPNKGVISYYDENGVINKKSLDYYI